MTRDRIKRLLVPEAFPGGDAYGGRAIAMRKAADARINQETSDIIAAQDAAWAEERARAAAAPLGEQAAVQYTPEELAKFEAWAERAAEVRKRAQSSGERLMASLEAEPLPARETSDEIVADIVNILESDPASGLPAGIAPDAPREAAAPKPTQHRAEHPQAHTTQETPVKPSFLTEPSGKPSATRLSLLSALVIILGTWAYVAIGAKELPDIPNGPLGVIGILSGVRIFQRSKETTE